MAAGRAKLLHQKTGKRVAIGRKSYKLLPCDLYNYNPYLINSIEDPDLKTGNCVWLFDHSGARPYIRYEETRQHPDNVGRSRPNRWVWNLNHKPEPMEIFFSEEEDAIMEARMVGRDYIIVQPHIKPNAPPQKRWPFDHFHQTVEALKDHVEIIQPMPYSARGDGQTLDAAQPYGCSVRELAMWISHAQAVVCNEGLLHHIAAAFHTPCVVPAGAYIPKHVVGYPYQRWFWSPDPRAQGVRVPSATGTAIMNEIKPKDVITAVKRILKDGR